MGMVSVLSPLLAMNPLFSVLLSYLFLQKEEKVTFKVVAWDSLRRRCGERHPGAVIPSDE